MVNFKIKINLPPIAIKNFRFFLFFIIGTNKRKKINLKEYVNLKGIVIWKVTTLPQAFSHGVVLRWGKINIFDTPKSSSLIDRKLRTNKQVNYSIKLRF